VKRLVTEVARRWRGCLWHTLAAGWAALLFGLLSSLLVAAAAVWQAGDVHHGTWALAAQNLVRHCYATLPVTVPACWLGLLGVSMVAPWFTRCSDRLRRWRRAVLGAAGAVVLLIGGGGLVASARLGTGSEAPHVVLIVIDTLRADRVGCYGSPRQVTPRIDALAGEAVVFQRAYSTAPWTRTAVASLLTGTTPFRHRITAEESTHALSPTALTLQEVLRNEGYWTRALLANPHYRFGIDQNFDRLSYCGNCRAEVIFTRAIEFIREHGDRPFFLLIHNNDPHDSYDYHPGFSTTPEDSPYRSLRELFPARDRPVALDSAVNARDTVILDAAALEEMKANYDGEIAYLDHHLGRFVDALRAQGLWQRTILVLTADHGEEFLDHGGYWHGGTLYDELLRVPLVVRVPGREGRVVGQPVSTRDLFATLIDLVHGNLPSASPDTGRTLRPLLEGHSLPATPIVAATAFRSRYKHSVIDGDYKLIAYATGQPIGLFNLREDPGERRNLYPVEETRARTLGRLLAAQVAAGGRDGRSDAATQLEANEREQLRALGYHPD
jgi:arylsulfatase A-like enzyme